LQLETDRGVIASRNERDVVVRRAATRVHDLIRRAIQAKRPFGGFVMEPRGVAGWVRRRAQQRHLDIDLRALGFDLCHGFEEDWMHFTLREDRGGEQAE